MWSFRFSLAFAVAAFLTLLNPCLAADVQPGAPGGAGNKQAKARTALDDSFQVFCGEWGKKLHERQVFNIKQIKWDSGQNWVQGTYVGYSEPLACDVEGDSGAVPVGKIIYHEVIYEKRGGSVTEAEREPGKAVETTEVTEIFRYQDGKWVY